MCKIHEDINLMWKNVDKEKTSEGNLNELSLPQRYHNIRTQIW
jgi:hypothetical protein